MALTEVTCKCCGTTAYFAQWAGMLEVGWRLIDGTEEGGWWCRPCQREGAEEMDRILRGGKPIDRDQAMQEAYDLETLHRWVALVERLERGGRIAYPVRFTNIEVASAVQVALEMGGSPKLGRHLWKEVEMPERWEAL